MKDTVLKLKNGLENLQRNAEARGDGYDQGFIKRMLQDVTELQVKLQGKAGPAPDAKKQAAKSLPWVVIDDCEGEMERFDTRKEAEDEVTTRIGYYLNDEGWREGVDQIVVARVVAEVKQVNRQNRPAEDEIDENGCDGEGEYWGDWDYRCDYELKPAEFQDGVDIQLEGRPFKNVTKAEIFKHESGECALKVTELCEGAELAFFMPGKAENYGKRDYLLTLLERCREAGIPTFDHTA
ncbi:hypothetical protein [Oceanisphaera sp. KMM 10153]|uniref:hypothetical protein n=1 Tax=Oceanisphaera submarina TaxID=3390193 RepID=UPI00397616E9